MAKCVTNLGESTTVTQTNKQCCKQNDTFAHFFTFLQQKYNFNFRIKKTPLVILVFMNMDNGLRILETHALGPGEPNLPPAERSRPH